MSKRKRFGVSQALTRGLSETINVVENNTGMYRNVILPLSRIELDPENPRKLAIDLQDITHGLEKEDPQFERKSEELGRLKELAYTIESSGIINPIVAYKRGDVYRVVAGERRCMASILAGKNEIEARIFTEKPRSFELKLIQWIENTAREDLTLEERVGNIQDIIQEYQNQQGKTAVTATLIKNLIGLSLPQASYYIAVMNAPEDVKACIQQGLLRSLDKAAIVASIESRDLRTQAIEACTNGINLKDLRKMVTREKQSYAKQQIVKKTSAVKRGRAVSRVNMGSTVKTGVIKALVNAVLKQTEFKHYATSFTDVDWNHFDHSTRAFKKLIEILEYDIKEI